MILEAKNIGFRYRNSEYIIKNVDFKISSNERVGIVGRSGYGKTTFGKILAGYLKPNWGELLLNNKEIPVKGFNPVQLINQHAEKSINPRWKMKKAINENVIVYAELLEILGIRETWLDRYPNELSGGELQRFAIARSITNETNFIVADEITAMHDGITQAQIWKSLIDISEKRNIGLIIITHNKELANRVCTRIVNLEEINNII